ncbi:MAG TPA: serine hydrolase domain-containing protein [Chryseosolibacter sp.]|nr:serine hydrolase domain-containing protein [Chryseosolibacter sp.]
MHRLFVILIVMLLGIRCSQTPMTTREPVNTVVGYKPPQFQDSNRLERLKRAFPLVDQFYAEHAKQNNFPAVAYGIVFDGKLVHSGATGVIDIEKKLPATTASMFRIASMTKSFTAMAIVRLRDEGKLALTDPAEKYIPEMKGFKYLTADAPKITIQNLLTMTAGFPEDNPWGDRQLEDTDQELIDFLKQGVAFSNIPGHRFEYSNLGYAILGNIVTRVSGVPYQKYIDDIILKPLGMVDTKWEYANVPKDRLAIGYRWEDEQWKEEPMLHDGAYGAMGGLITTIDDFSKYLALHLAALPPSSEADTGPVARSSLREMHRPFLPTLFADAKTARGEPCPIVSGYAYGLGVRQDCKGIVRISHSGGLPGFGSEYRFYPDYGIGVICFANKTYANAGSVNARVIDTLMAIAKLQPRAIPPSDILTRKKEQLISLLSSWDEKLGAEILAENFFLDRSRESWMRHAGEVLQETGKIVAIEPLVPQNQLRGTFRMIGEKKALDVFFTLSPEIDPKVQQLDLYLVDGATGQR